VPDSDDYKSPGGSASLTLTNLIIDGAEGATKGGEPAVVTPLGTKSAGGVDMGPRGQLRGCVWADRAAALTIVGSDLVNW
jgi:hypothetical protein